MTQTVGIAGLGAIGSAVGRALESGIEGLTWVAASDPRGSQGFDIEMLSFEEMAARCDIIIEALPPAVVPSLVTPVFAAQKTLILISSCALLMYPEIEVMHKDTNSRILVPSGALGGIDGVKALKELGLQKCKIASTKHPRGFKGAPYVDKMGIDLDQITAKTLLFEGNALEAAKGFPANVNVAATLALAGNGPEDTHVEIWADPDAQGNAHEIFVEGAFSSFTARIENKPDPANPKSSMLAAQSIVAVLKDMSEALVVY